MQNIEWVEEHSAARCRHGGEANLDTLDGLEWSYDKITLLILERWSEEKVCPKLGWLSEQIKHKRYQQFCNHMCAQCIKNTVEMKTSQVYYASGSRCFSLCLRLEEGWKPGRAAAWSDNALSLFSNIPSLP